jgi:hypothetical protein
MGTSPKPAPCSNGTNGTQLNYGWWTVLEPYLTATYKQETEAARQQARKDLENENNALLHKLRQMRSQQ